MATNQTVFFIVLTFFPKRFGGEIKTIKNGLVGCHAGIVNLKKRS